MSPTLFSYVVRDDAGSAPNPFWGVCTLVICKPRIRRAAQVGDWLVGTGPADSPVGDIRGKVVYAMQVTNKMPMHKYDKWAQDNLPEKVPDPLNRDLRRWLGDAIYDFNEDPPRIRPGSVHNDSNRQTDLNGEYALLSEHFFYFGNQPIALPEHLRGLVQRAQGHRSVSNAPYLEPFLDWLNGLGLQPNHLYGKPQLMQLPSVHGLEIGSRP